MRAAVHSRVNSKRKKGMANNTGSRISAGSPEKKPEIALTADRLLIARAVCAGIWPGISLGRHW
ncbi:hypothetical protein MPRG_26150 [Mycobacterium paragordonae]|uniref:Uncharacterized protein n=1 Tax=Mycobacterium paragordonae TaxID=1389713 RepID=A0ABQ1C4P8_9MYCO|nr:hypothetical protein MPRG_26150 [Mycobacterium paragordonae]